MLSACITDVFQATLAVSRIAMPAPSTSRWLVVGCCHSNLSKLAGQITEPYPHIKNQGYDSVNSHWGGIGVWLNMLLIIVYNNLLLQRLSKAVASESFLRRNISIGEGHSEAIGFEDRVFC